MAKHTHRPILSAIKTKAFSSISLGVLCTLGAFVIGIRSAGDLQPFATSEAALQATVGDSLHPLGLRDAIGILEFAEGLESPAPEDVRRLDVDGDYRLTVKDALRVLHALSVR